MTQLSDAEKMLLEEMLQEELETQRAMPETSPTQPLGERFLFPIGLTDEGEQLTLPKETDESSQRLS